MISVCMCSYRRAPQLAATLDSIAAQSVSDIEVIVCEDGFDGGATREVCERYGARYLQRADRPEQPYSNPSVPWNIALRAARGDVMILQNPECRHVGHVVERLAAPHAAEKDVALFAAVRALAPDGSFWQWYVHPQYSPRPFFFCGSVRRENVWAVGGFDEEFGDTASGSGGYGYDDDWFALALSSVGVRFLFSDEIVVDHQWHESTNCYGLRSNMDLYIKKVEGFGRGEVDFRARSWGAL